MENSLFDKTAIAYDQWFEDHENAWRSELLAVKQFIPKAKHGLKSG